jgi:hypothetical protein
MGLVDHAGIVACRLVLAAAEITQNRFVLTRIAIWVHEVPLIERNRSWAQVIQTILADRDFTLREIWDATQLLRELVWSAYPGPDEPRPAAKLVIGIRHVTAQILAGHIDPNATIPSLDSATISPPSRWALPNGSPTSQHAAFWI